MEILNEILEIIKNIPEHIMYMGKDLAGAGMFVGFVVGFPLRFISDFFRKEGGDYKSNDIIIEGKFDRDGKFTGSATPDYGYKSIPGDRTIIGRILGGIGAGLIAWTMASWGLQFLNCFSCFIEKDMNAMAKHDGTIGVISFLIGIVVGIIDFRSDD